ncbi:hypothetical protein [Enterococcus larvae]|uniref:hypothetical protein n=1 Tax=Enterococcus larvae TaxID=2794352 RepID=UPI003F3A42EF
MENRHSTDGLAEDLIRSFVQIASAEMHTKTLLEKRTSELENGFVQDSDIENVLKNIKEIQEELIELAEIRRSDMLLLFELYGAEGDKEQWCMVKHLGIAMMTAFEVWQASNNDSILQELYLRKNRLFIKSVSKFLGVTITECAACFADILKGEVTNG